MTEIRELANIVGKENILDSNESLSEFSKDESFVNPVRPKCIVKLRKTEQVQNLVNWANETLTPLIPVSSGAPHFRGDTVPSIGGSIIVDLSDMKNVIRIDSENRIAIVEPGVTFEQLIPELEKNGLRLNMPLIPRHSKSVVGSLLEREPVIMPRYHWDLIDPLVCTEVIYGNGHIFRTGSAAGPGTLEEQWEVGAAQNEASGPVQADFVRLIQGAQGTMGIVTWASIRCEQLPVLEEPFLVGSSNLEKLLDLIRLMVNGRLVDNCLVLNSANLSHIIGKESSQGNERRKDFLPKWTLFYSISGTKYFPEEKIKYQIQDTSEYAKSLGLEPVRQVGEASAFDIASILRKPPGEPYWKLKGKGSCHDIFFLATEDKLSKLNDIIKHFAVKYDYPLSEMGIYIQPQVQGVCYHCEYSLFFNPEDQAEYSAVRELSTVTIDPLADEGAFFSRPYGPWADMAYRRDAQTTLGLRKIKKIFDPNNIMNPGKLCFYD
jgi:hypothetical protein